MNINSPTSPTPPPDSEPGDLWYNTTNGHFYVFDECNRWVATDMEDHVVDVIEVEDPIKAYDRAMSIL